MVVEYKSSQTLDNQTLNEYAAESSNASPLSRRLGTLMLFRISLITLVLGATTFVYWLEDADLALSNAKFLYGLIALTYFLTLVYALLLKANVPLKPLATFQLVGDIVIATALVHVTGGAQSAYSFFFPLSVIAAAALLFRRGAIYACVFAGIAFAITSILGWKGIIPPIEGQPILPSELSTLEFGRSMTLNLAAIIGMGALAINLGTQLEDTNVAVAEHRSVAADLMTLHRDIVHSLASGVVTIDLSDRVSSFNEAAKEILNVSAGIDFRPQLSEISTELADMVSELAPTAAIRRGELTVKKGGDDMVLGISVTPLVDHRMKTLGRIINFQDLSEMKQMEANVQRSERLAVIGGLAAGVAHEIRNPLASISGSIELLRDLPNIDHDNKALMNIVTREITRLNALITDLLDYTTPKPLNRSETDVQIMIEEIIQVFSQDKKFFDIHIETTFDSGNQPQLYDKEKIRQALWNLIHNAGEAANDGRKTIHIHIKQSIHWLQIDINDTGPGIPKDKIDKIFDPFFTTKATGTGLGLATTHSIVSDHGGTLNASSVVGQGAKFSIRLPKG